MAKRRVSAEQADDGSFILHMDPNVDDFKSKRRTETAANEAEAVARISRMLVKKRRRKERMV